ncbi:hypothetical protein [Photobacterium swingsii]|uniref:hypothetical protein n=1 Tax=Photobacterium swingsii TaxID=680026 RepID=UPI004068B1BC
MKKLILSALIATTLVGCGGSKKNDNVDPEPALQNHQGVFLDSNFNVADQKAPEFVKLSVKDYKVGFTDLNDTPAMSTQIALTGAPEASAKQYTFNDDGSLKSETTYKVKANIEKDILTLSNPDDKNEFVTAKRIENHWKNKGDFLVENVDIKIEEIGDEPSVLIANNRYNLEKLSTNVYERFVSASDVRSLLKDDTIPDSAQLSIVFTMFKLDTTDQLLVSIHALESNENLVTLYGPEKTTP